MAWSCVTMPIVMHQPKFAGSHGAENPSSLAEKPKLLFLCPLSYFIVIVATLDPRSDNPTRATIRSSLPSLRFAMDPGTRPNSQFPSPLNPPASPLVDEKNPYQPPRISKPLGNDERMLHEQSRVLASPLILSIEWTIILAFNLIVPALVAWAITSTSAKLGSGFAIFLMALTGYYFCITKPLPMLFIIRGGVLVALSQFVPALQLVAGAISIHALILVRVVTESSFNEMLSTPLAGFLVTLLTGLILISVSLTLGFLIRIVTPDRWWLAKSYGTNLQPRD